MVRIHIGIDDTDSPKMGCTTYVAALMVQKLHKLGASFIDYPNLIRLNPNVPWKTRGNGALSLRIECYESSVEDIKEIVIQTVEENSDVGFEGTEPGIVFLFGEVPEDIEVFAKNTIQGLVRMDKALRLIKSFEAEAVGFKNGRGIIGGLASIGERLRGDHTYEFIAYRTPENRATPRKVDVKSVVEMDEKTKPLTFNNVDPETGRILITPRGPDPILYGIRGENSEIVKYAHEFIHSDEPVERWIVFRTNHGTDAHLRRVNSIKEVKPYNPVIVSGTVVEEPRVIPGGHVIFSIRDETARVDCAAYEPTGDLRNVAKVLKQGDTIEAMGGVRPSSSRNPITVNLEKIHVVKLVPHVVFQNPLCPDCGKRMKSMGKEKGFRCEKCGLREPRLQRLGFEVRRDLDLGIYITPPRSQRHLTKPFSRYGLEKKSYILDDHGVPYHLFSSL